MNRDIDVFIIHLRKEAYNNFIPNIKFFIKFTPKAPLAKGAFLYQDEHINLQVRQYPVEYNYKLKALNS